MIAIVGYGFHAYERTLGDGPQSSQSSPTTLPAGALNLGNTDREYLYPGDGFAIELPARPRRVAKTESEGGVPYQDIQYQLERDGISGAYMVMVSHLPPPAVPRDVTADSLRALRDEAGYGMNASVEQEETVWTDGHLGLESTFRVPGQGTLHHRVYVVRGTLYQVFVAKLGEDKAKRVLKTFRLLGNSLALDSGRWHEYYYPEDGFAMELPALPKKRIVSVPARPEPYTVTTYELDSPDFRGSYRVMVTHVSESVRAHGVDMDYMRRIRDEAVKMTGGTRRRERAALCGQHVGLECVIDMPINGAQHHQIFYVEPHVFQVFIGGLGPSDTTRAFEGFRILGTTSGR